MLNNRQQSGRRRGRGGQRQQGNGGRGPEQGNRIDNRARGNAPQLLDKYKALARDAQMAGDRVMTEYYLQFADHYFRVVAESRARYEEQRRQRGDWQSDDDDGYDGEERAANDDRANDDRDSDDQDGEGRDDGEQQAYEPRRREMGREQGREQGRDQNRDREPRDNREGRGNREPRNRDNDRDGNRDDRPRRGPREDRGPREGRNGRGYQEANDAPATIDVAVLPPSFGSDGPLSPIPDLPMGLEGDADDAPAPKRRGRPRKVVAETAE